MDMSMQRVWSLVQVVPVVASLMGLTAGSVDAAEVSSFATGSAAAPRPAAELPSLSQAPGDWLETEAFETTDPTISAEPVLQFSKVDRSMVTEISEQQPETNAVSQLWTDEIAKYEWQISQGVVLDASLTEDTVSASAANPAAENAAVVFSAVSNPVLSPLESAFEQPTSTLAEDLNQAPFTPFSASEAEDFGFTSASSKTQLQFIPLAPFELKQLAPEQWQLAQAEPASESDTPQTAPEAEASSPRWRFSFAPYGFVPLNTSGDVTVRDFTVDLDLSLSDILEQLDFALAGRAEAWRGNLGIIFDGAYFKFGDDISTSLSIPNCLCNIFPSEIDTEVDVQYGQFDLGVGYRHGTNLSSAATEFDMGPMVFDAIIGMRIYTFRQEIHISTNVGTERNLEGSTTLITPLASGRIRWNLSPTVAGWVRGDMAGFGIGGTLLAASVTGGMDWIFSGNTSLQLAYRLASLGYNTEVEGQELGLNLLSHGPYVGVVFRF